MYLAQIYGKTYAAGPNVCKNWHKLELNGKKKMKAPTLYTDFKRDL